MIDISGKLSPQLVEVYQHVSVAAEALDVRYVVVGAVARDLVLHYGYDAPVERATTDVDFGIRVATAAYSHLRHTENLTRNRIREVPQGRLSDAGRYYPRRRLLQEMAPSKYPTAATPAAMWLLQKYPAPASRKMTGPTTESLSSANRRKKKNPGNNADASPTASRRRVVA